MPPKSFEHLVGHRFPGGTYRLPDYESWLWADAVEATPSAEAAHPGIAYMIGLQGGGASIEDIFQLLEADRDSGVLFGELDLEIFRQIRPGAIYAVEGEVTAVERKLGRKAGVFDRVTFLHRVLGEDGDPVVDVRHIWIFPRAEGEE